MAARIRRGPLIGLLAERFGVLRALLVVLVAIGLGLAASGAARPLPLGRPAEDEPVSAP